MAQMPALATGLPTVEPGRVPDDYQRVQASPETFGAQGARDLQAGAQNLNQGLQRLSAGLEQAAQTYDRVAADDMANQFQKQVGALMNGDPDAVGPDGRPSDLGFMGTAGRNTLDARKSVETKITDLQREMNGKLRNPQQQRLFTDFANRYSQATTEKISTHSREQEKVWSKGVNDSTAGLALQQVAANPSNPQALAAAASDYVNARVKNAELAGAQPGDEVWNATIAGAKRDVLKTQLQAMATTEPAKALEILNQPGNRQIAGVDYDNLATAFRARASEQVGLTAAERALAGSVSAPTPQPQPTAEGQSLVYTAILNQESSDNPNAPMSVNGAVGPAQIMPGTFQKYAQPGERMDNRQDNRAVGARIVADYERRWPDDPARVAVAYFSGEGNVAPEGSPTPWKRDVVDGNGKSVSSYVDNVSARVASLGLKSRIAGTKANAIAAINSDPSLDPKARSVALTRINQQFQTLEVARLADEAQKKAAEEQAADSITKAILGGQTDELLDQIRNNPNLTSAKREHLADMLRTHLTSDNDRDLKTYGPGFYDIWKRVHAPQNDPNRITDPSELYAMVGPKTDVNGKTVPGQLTVSGVDKLTQEIMGRRTPEGESFSAMKTQFFANAKSQISGSNDFFKMRDPKGEELFLKFQAEAFPLIEKGIKEGKTAGQLFNPDSPDYVGKGITGFKRTPAQMMADLESAGTNLAAGTGKPKVDTSTPDGLRAAVSSGAISRQAGIDIARERGWIRTAVPATPQPAQPQVPIR